MHRCIGGRENVDINRFKNKKKPYDDQHKDKISIQRFNEYDNDVDY